MPASAPAPLVTQPLLCPSCQGPVPLGSGTHTVCPYCGAEVPIPAQYLALREAARQSGADRAKAERLYAQLGRPPGPALRLWGTVAQSAGGCLWGMFNLSFTTALEVLGVLPFALAHFFAPWTGVDLMDRFGASACDVSLFVAFMLLVVLPAELFKTANERASTRLALQKMLAAVEPAEPGGVSRCRRCGAPLTVQPGALGARCDYCHVDNLVALPAEWLETETRQRVENHDAVASAAEQEKKLRAKGAQRLFVAGGVLLVGAPLAVGAGHVFPSKTPRWSASHGAPRAFLRVGHPGERLPAGRAHTLVCTPAEVRPVPPEDKALRALGAVVGDPSSIESLCSWRYWVALDDDERITLETPNATRYDTADLFNARGARTGHALWERSKNGNWLAAFRAPYTGYFQVRVHFLGEGRESPLLWTPGVSPPPIVRRPKTKERELKAASDVIEQLAFSPDGRQLALAAHYSGAVIVDLQSRRVVRAIGGGLSYPVMSVAWSPDGRHLAVGSAKGFVRVYDARGSGKFKIDFMHDGAVKALAFSPDGKWLASAARSAVRVWDVAHHYQLHAEDDGPLLVQALAFSPSSTSLAMTGGDRRVHLLTLHAKPVNALRLKHAGAALAYTRDGTRLVVASGGQLTEWPVSDSPSLAGTPLPLGHQSPSIFSLSVATQARAIATASAGKRLTVWPLGPGRPPMDLPRLPAPSHAVAFGPKERRLAVGLDDGRVIVWSLRAGAAWNSNHRPG